MTEEKPASLQDILGITNNSFNENERRQKEEGCVIRALESVFGEKATAKEYRLRFDDIDTVLSLADILEKYSDLISEKSGVVSDLLSEQVEKDLINTLSLICGISQCSSNLGREIRKTRIEFRRNASGEDLATLIKDGQIEVIALGFVGIMTSELEVNNHAMHLGIKDGKFIRLSDNNSEINIDNDIELKAIIFHKDGET